MSKTVDLVKYRKGKISSRQHDGRVWIPDRELQETAFVVGAEFSVSIKEENHLIEVLPGGKRRVSHRKISKSKIAPVIDIKNLRVKHALDGCDYITVAIYRDRIIIRGHKHTANAKVEEYKKDRTPLKLTSFTFFADDAPARAAGFESRGSLLTEDAEGVTYSVPLAEFEASILPQSHAWFVHLQGQKQENILNAMHLLRLYSQVETAKRPYVIVVNSSNPQELAPVEIFLQSDGYYITRHEQKTVFSVLEGWNKVNQDIYKSVYEFLSNGLEKIEKRVPITVVSFYSGCISDLAFKDEGFKILKAYDLNKELADQIGLDNFSDPEESYRLNIGDEFTPTDIASLNHSEIPEAEIYVFSPPCHGMTIANQQTRFIDNPKNKHMWYTLEIIKSKKPPMFIIEQVPDVLKIGAGIFIRDLKQELGSLYSIAYRVIDAADCGTAQHRERAIFIGSRLGEINIPEIKAERYKTVKEALTGITEDLFNQLDITENKPETVIRMSYVKPGENWRSIPPELRTKRMGESTHSNVYRRLDPHKPSCTITNFRKTNLIHPYENRGLSVREAARLMDIPDLYCFIGSLSDKQQQVANGIPLALVKTVARIVRSHYQEILFKKSHQHTNRIIKKEPKISTVPVPNLFGQLSLFDIA